MGNILTVQLSCDALFTRCLDCCVGRTTYVCNIEDNLVALRTKMDDLIEARNDVMRRVTIAERQQMTRLNRVQLWLTRVQGLAIEVDQLQEVKSQEVERLCLGGFCSKNCKSSYKFGKKVAKKLREVSTLIDEGAFHVVADRQPEAAVEERPIEPTVGLESTLDKVWSCLGEENVGIIGLYGMGGVGKTTLLTQINNKFLDSRKDDFDVVIWVVVSKDLKIERIQDDIWKKIGLCDNSWRSKSLEDKAVDIFRVLSKKKFVLLLDDMWKRVDLTQLGVPLPSPTTASKVAFTTRFVEVCGAMKAHEYFKVECLAHEKAWILFQEHVERQTLESHPDIPELAETVTKECGGLPLALITIGRAMACKKQPEDWKYAIQVLRRSASEFPGMDEVYPRLKFSYDSLPGEKIRSCFLYCCLFPEDYKIHKMSLIDYWISEKILDNNDRSRAINEGYYIIGVVLHSCLLEEAGNDWVKMHDVIRDMALWIATEIEKEKENYLVEAGAGLTEVQVLQGIERWKGVRKISLMQNQIRNLPFTPICPDLQTLFLKGINELPRELKALVNLKYLNLDHTTFLHPIPSPLISSFSMLLVLRMFNCKSSSMANVVREVLIDELVQLDHLNELSMSLHSIRALERFLSFHKLKSCTGSLYLNVWEHSNWLDVLSLGELKNLHTLHMQFPFLDDLKFGCVRVGTHAFHSLHTVRIYYCSKLRDLTWLALAPNLRKIEVHTCANMEEIISPGKISQVQNLNPFAKLEYLVLENLMNLKSIYWSPLPFPQLMEIRVNGCPILQKLPLDSSSAKDRKIVIRAKQHSWWANLKWEDEAAKNAFSHCWVHA
ncbi:probable disease resistance protein At5g63020 [Citrus sinensis]|uniref:probable disease resistance protein At5g63020 n=1 Tax=Citrus sinensis TaxID=2711 RepID=UPI0022781086|nr:probable disease resistance protein At5g63020 [Citrus sinensis]